MFDGISCGQIALERAALNVSHYYASEINESAIKITQKHYPDTVQLGDVQKIKGADLPPIDLLIGGPPCQGFSSSGKELNFEDPRSKLFFEFVRLLKECKPKYFLLENVVMKKEYQNIISSKLNVEPLLINSSLLSAQNRNRLYWTNIPNITLPQDKHIQLKDILETNIYPNKATIIGRRLNSEGKREDYNKSIPIVQCLEVRKTNTNKCNCLTTVQKDNVLTNLPPRRYVNVFQKNLPFRFYTPIEYERLQTLPDNYTEGISNNQRFKAIGNGWTVDIIAHILKNLKTRF